MVDPGFPVGKWLWFKKNEGYGLHVLPTDHEAHRHYHHQSHIADPSVCAICIVFFVVPREIWIIQVSLLHLISYLRYTKKLNGYSENNSVLKHRVSMSFL